MAVVDGSTRRPFFLRGAAGLLFAIYHPPRVEREPAEDVIFIPPFAEEQNRSRRMATLQAESLAEIGVGTLLIDLFGCGDSAGDFADARWEIWRGDVLAAAAWLRGQRESLLSLLGLRLGGALALDVACQEGEAWRRIVVWQPVVSGASMLNQFLRLRVASKMDDTNDTKESTDDLRRQLDQGGNVEVAGYAVDSSLAGSISSLDLRNLQIGCEIPVFWFEIVRSEGRALSPVSDGVLGQFRDNGVPVKSHCVIGEPFWSLPESSSAPALLSATRRVFEGPQL